MTDANAKPAVPTDLASMLSLQGEMPRLPVPANAPVPLRKLGPSPFPKSGFPALGFLETVYEHIQDRAQHRIAAAAPKSEPPAS